MNSIPHQVSDFGTEKHARLQRRVFKVDSDKRRQSDQVDRSPSHLSGFRNG